MRDGRHKREQADSEPKLAERLRKINEQLVIRSIQAKAEMEELQRRAAELDSIIAALPNPVLVFGVDGTTLRANHAASISIGFNPTSAHVEFLIRKLSIRHPDGRPIREDELASIQALQGRKVVGRQLVFTDAEGREVTVVTSASPLITDDKLWGIVVTWRQMASYDCSLSQSIEKDRPIITASSWSRGWVNEVDLESQAANPSEGNSDAFIV